MLPFPGVGVRRFAFRYAVTSTRDNKRGYTDHIAWDRGRASSGLIVASAGTPPRRAFELRLARRIDARMRP